MVSEKTARLIVFCVVTAGIVAMAYAKQDPAVLVAIATYLMKSPADKAGE